MMARYTGLCVCGRELEVARHPEGRLFMNCFDCFPQFEKVTGREAEMFLSQMEKIKYELEMQEMKSKSKGR